MKLDTDKAQAMSLNIDNERREFCNAVRADENLPYDIRKSTDDGIMAYMPAHFEGWLAAKRAAVGSTEPVAFAFVIVDKNGNPEFVTSTHDEAQEHINDAISEHHIQGAGKWRSIPAYEMRPSDDKMWDQALRERDYNAEIADKLADAISQYFNEEIGEHSNANCPWLEALRIIEEAAPPAPVSAEPVTIHDALRWSKANRDYHGYIAFTPDQLKLFVSHIQSAPAAPLSDAKDALDEKRRRMFAAYSDCLISGGLPNDIADKLIDAAKETL